MDKIHEVDKPNYCS